MLAALAARAGPGGTMNFGDFVEVALYAPGIGYYRRERGRVGYAPGADFLTATTSSPLFGRLVVAACASLIGAGSPADYEFVEIGSEPGEGILGRGPHPFRSARQARIGEPLDLRGRCIVFSNELFDAQPFRRFRFREGAWRESGVAVGPAGLTEVEVAAGSLPALPAAAPEGYRVDAPLAAARLAEAIAAEPWSGLFLAFDYGKSWEEIAFDTPGGTARSYRRHVQGNDLLANPGDQDLTCHVCWDWIEAALAGKGFTAATLESQEAFLIHHSAGALAALAASEAGRLSREKLSLMQLLHPAHMGQKFQALWALRDQAPAS
jgi:SAM-dependent MidA family methyltransferase